MKKIKPVLQNDLKDCGVCCMQWIIMYYDGYVSLEKLREDTLTDINGTSAYHIVEAFKKWGFDATGVLEHNIKSSNLLYPFIAHVVLENGLEHFVVIKEISKNTIYIMDPGIGNVKMTTEKFAEIFTGHIINAYPRTTIIKMSNELSISKLFLNIMIKEKFLVTKIIITSIIWSILLIICSYYLKIGSSVLSEDVNLLKYVMVCFGVLTILKVFLLYIRDYYENHLSNLVDIYLYPEFLRHLFSLPSKNIKSRSTGEIATRIEELANIKSLFSDIFVSCFLDSIMMVISIVILYLINANLFIIFMIFISVYIIIGVIVSKIMYKKILENINYHTDFNSVIIESIDMFASIKNLNICDLILNKIERVLSKYLFNNYNFAKFFDLTSLSKNFILEICLFVINSYGFWNIYKGNLTIIDLFTFNIIISYCLDPVKNIIALLPRFNYIKASFSKITEFINLQEENISSGNVLVDGDIVLKNVSYSYNNFDNILDDCNLTIKKGSHVLLKGNSGSGKSTICKIIYKENIINKGIVLIGDYNINDLSLQTIRNNILYISQNEKLFSGSIKENILIDRDVSDNDFQKICKLCMIDEIVSKKGMRYDSILETDSQNVSGGERQRIILARGLLKKANIIILDEALSEVDENLENTIVRNIRKYYKDKTIIYISHKNQENNFKNIIRIGEKSGLLQN